MSVSEIDYPHSNKKYVSHSTNNKSVRKWESELCNKYERKIVEGEKKWMKERHIQ